MHIHAGTKPIRLTLFGMPLLVLTAVFGTAPTANAQSQSTYPAEVENRCRDDYFRFCSPYALGSDELRRCMEANGTALSSRCQQALIDGGYVRKSLYSRGKKL